jgi:hypothetical protein
LISWWVQHLLARKENQTFGNESEKAELARSSTAIKALGIISMERVIDDENKVMMIPLVISMTSDNENLIERTTPRE